MTKYLVFPTTTDALSRSHEIFVGMCKAYDPEQVTQFAFGTIEHEDTKEGAMVIPDDWLAVKHYYTKAELLEAADKANLETDAQLKSKGWLKDKPNSELEAPPIVMGMALSSKWTWDTIIKPLAKLAEGV